MREILKPQAFGFSRRQLTSFNSSMLHLGTRMNTVTNPSPTSKPAFKVNGFGGAKLVGAEEMYQFGIIPVD